ncbi:MAG: hotdog fold thioesterase [Vibrionaceae bacterium]
MSIWKKKLTLDTINGFNATTLVAHLGITFTDIGRDSLTATMPVDNRTHQPFGFLHGGASVALAESVGSMAGNLAVANSQYCVGLEVNANHLKAMQSGLLTAKATPLHLGRATHVWHIELRNDEQELICISRLTLAVLDKKISTGA